MLALTILLVATFLSSCMKGRDGLIFILENFTFNYIEQ